MSKVSMLDNLEILRNENYIETENILLDLMDFVVGYCDSDLSVFCYFFDKTVKNSKIFLEQ